MNKLLACTAFAAASLFADTAFASDDAPAPRCKVGNGKSATYDDRVHACVMTRAAGQQQLVQVQAATPAPAPAEQAQPKPAARPRPQARRAGTR